VLEAVLEFGARARRHQGGIVRAPGTGQVIEVQAGKRYKVRALRGYSPKGAPLLRTETVRGTFKDAQRRLRAIQREIDQGSTAGGRETFGDLLDDWVKDTGRSWKPSTARTNGQVIEATIRPTLGRVQLTKLTARKISDLYQGMYEAGRSAATVRRCHALIRAALAYGVKQRRVDRNEADFASLDPVGDNRRSAPSAEAVIALIEACDRWHIDADFSRRDASHRHDKFWLANLLRLAASCGPRLGEICALRWSDVDLESGVISISRSFSDGAEGPPKTKAGIRTFPLLGAGLEALRWHRENCESEAARLDLSLLPDGYVFSPELDGSAPYSTNAISRAVKRVVDDAGLETITVHHLLHFAATVMMTEGMDPATVSYILGHARPTVTLNLYTGAPTNERMREALATLAKALDATTKALPART
jgi:integrase